MNSKVFPIVLCLLAGLVFYTPAYSAENKVRFGIEGGLAYADIGAAETAQTIANLSGSTVTYKVDEYAAYFRLYLDYFFSKNFGVEVGAFLTDEVIATYTLSGASASEAYSMHGVDASLVLKGAEAPLFLKLGIHNSQVDGRASITIGGTTYAATAAARGTGMLIGVGYQEKDGGWRSGITYYSDVGGLSKADITLVYIGFTF